MHEKAYVQELKTITLIFRQTLFDQTKRRPLFLFFYFFLNSIQGSTTAIFNKNMLESMSIQILPTYCLCCTILLIIKIN